MELRVNQGSSVPAELRDYHFFLNRANALSKHRPEEALELLWSAFEYYLEPQPLSLARKLLEPCPEVSQSMAYFSHLLYPKYFSAVGPTQRSTQRFDLPQSVTDFLLPKHLPKISLCMIVRNEIDCLPACLQSVSDLAQEVIVCDTGSTDGTLEFLKQRPEISLSVSAWQDDYSLARNVSLSQASGDWVLVLDADEILTVEAREYLKKLLSYPPLGWQLMTLQIEHLRQPLSSTFSRAARIFRRSEEIQYTGVIHELPVKQTLPSWLLMVDLPIKVIHSGNLPERYKLKNKTSRLVLLSEALNNNPTPYLRYQFSHMQFLDLKEGEDDSQLETQLKLALDETLRYQGKLPPYAEWLPAPLDALIHLCLQVCFRRRDYQAILGLYQNHKAYWIFAADFYLLAVSAQALEQFFLAEKALLRCLDARLPRLGTSFFWRDRAYLGLLDLSLAAQDGIFALFIVRRLLEHHPEGIILGKDYDLKQVQNHLEQQLKLERGTWLDRLEFGVRTQLADHNLSRVADLVLFYLYDSWDKTVLCDALRVMAVFRQPDLALHLTALGRCLYPHETFFQDEVALVSNAEKSELKKVEFWWNLISKPIERPKISICMIVRNAEDSLLKALQSVAFLADEFVIADTGSEDQTLSILQEWGQKYPLKLLHLAWRDDFSWARNQVLEAASGDWILNLDADEELSSDSVSILQELCTYQPVGLQIFALRCESQRSRPELLQQDWLPRLFRRHSNIRYWGSVHERPGHAWRAERLPVQPLTGVCLKHTGYLPSVIQKHRKWERNKILAENLEISGHPNPYFLFHQAYVLLEQGDAGSVHQGLDLLQQAKSETLRFQGRPPVAGWFAAPLGKVRLMLFRYWYRHAKSELIRTAYVSEALEMNDPEYHFYYAQVVFQAGDSAEAGRVFRLCLEFKPGALPMAGFHSWRPLLGLAKIALGRRDWLLGVDLWLELLSLDCPLPLQRMYAEWWQQMVS